MEEQQQNYSDLVNQEIKDQNKPIKWEVDGMPQTRVGQMKKEAVYIFWFEFIGTFMLTFSIYASNNNLFVFSCAYGMLILVAQNQKCTFNPAITTVLSGNDKGLWVSVAIASQFGGAFLASMFGFFCFKNYVNEVPYLSQTTLEEYFAVIIGEILGSLILTAGFLFQYDDLMDFTSDRLEHSIIISGLYGVGRTLSYVAKSSLNPAIAMGLVFFECCKDGHWGRFWNLWIYTGLPFVGAFISLTLIRILYCQNKINFILGQLLFITTFFIQKQNLVSFWKVLFIIYTHQLQYDLLEEYEYFYYKYFIIYLTITYLKQKKAYKYTNQQ